MLSASEARRLEDWAGLATLWGEASQCLVGASGDLAISSRDLADRFDRDASAGAHDAASRRGLAGELRQLATVVEEESEGLRNGHMATAAGLEQLRSIGR